MSSFSALQRAEIAEIVWHLASQANWSDGFSALQRAEIAEIPELENIYLRGKGFSALQRAEIAEITKSELWRLSKSGFQCSSTSRNC